MKRSPREQLIFLAAILFTAAPIAFGVIRALQTGSDLRYLWVAIAAYLGANVVMSAGKARSRTTSGVFTLAIAATVIGTIVAGLAAKFMTHTASSAAWLVALFFAFCFAAGSALYAISRPRTN